jgi:hypothetical protein
MSMLAAPTPPPSIPANNPRPLWTALASSPSESSPPFCTHSAPLTVQELCAVCVRQRSEMPRSTRPGVATMSNWRRKARPATTADKADASARNLGWTLGMCTLPSGPEAATCSSICSTSSVVGRQVSSAGRPQDRRLRHLRNPPCVRPPRWHAALRQAPRRSVASPPPRRYERTMRWSTRAARPTSALPRHSYQTIADAFIAAAIGIAAGIAELGVLSHVPDRTSAVPLTKCIACRVPFLVTIKREM